MLLGLRSAIYPVDDIVKAKAWYAAAFGIQPYFDEPFYVGFNVGGFELGLDPDVVGVKRGSKAIVWWGVADVKLARDALVASGARAQDEVQAVGEDIFVATVRDPWGNVLGLIQNPHFGEPPA